MTKRKFKIRGQSDCTVVGDCFVRGYSQRDPSSIPGIPYGPQGLPGVISEQSQK